MARYALVIGIANYDNFRNLPKATTDAEAIAQLLEQHRYTVVRLPRELVSEKQWAIAPNKKLTAAELSNELKIFLRERAIRQEVVIYFAGHGFRVTDTLTDEEVGYLATSDSAKDGQNAIRVDALNTLINKSDLSSLVMLMDCCYAGTLIEQHSLLQPAQGMISHKQNHCLIAACRDFERAREGEQHGIFTAAVLQGLSADNAVNGDITSADLLSFVSRTLQPSGQEVIHAGMGQSILLVSYQPTQAKGTLGRKEELKEGKGQSCQAYGLAKKMRAWFETLGYSFESYEVWEIDCFEWIINFPIRRNRYNRVLVRGISGEAGLKEIAALRQSASQQRTDEGWLVTTRRISRAAREEMGKEENQQLGCYTFDELLDQDADFNGYLSWLEAEIQKHQIEHRYVPLACTKEEFDPDTKQRIGVSRYDERDGWIDGYVDLWLDDPAKEHLSVLGEFGTGKTWFALHYAWKALQRYRDAQQRGIERPRLPLVIPLRDYAKALSVESLFSEFFFRKHKIPIPHYAAFEQLNRMGKLLLIFDGFDEMAAKIDRQQMINNFWSLAKVVVPSAKVILTCRTEHFPEAKEGRALLNAELQASTEGLTGETPQFEVLELEKFNDIQIFQVLSQQTRPEIVEQIMNNPKLLDLARRPVMVELILEALPDIEAGKHVDMSRVYLYAISHKMERDIKAERTFTSLADKLYFLCELSWEMLSTDQMSLNYRQFPDRIRRLFGSVVQKEKDLDHWHYDMMSQTILIRNADGDYTPAHRSFLEFFVAYKFAAELGVLPPDFLELAQEKPYMDIAVESQEYKWSEYFIYDTNGRNSIGPKPRLLKFTCEELDKLTRTIGLRKLTKAVLDLLQSILAQDNSEAKRSLLSIILETKDKSTEQTNWIGANLIALLIKLDPEILISKNFVGVNFSKANFAMEGYKDILDYGTEIKFSNTNFQSANLEKSIFGFEDLSEVNFKDSNLSGIRFKLKQFDGLSIHPNGKQIVVSSHDDIMLWDLQSRLLQARLDTNGSWSARHSPNGEFLVNTIWGGFEIRDSQTLDVISVHQNSRVKLEYAHGERENLWTVPFTFTSDSRKLFIGCNNSIIYVWDFLKRQEINVLKEHTSSVRYIAISRNDELLVSSSYEEVIAWDMPSLKPLAKKRWEDTNFGNVIFHPNNTILAVDSVKEEILNLSFNTLEILDRYPASGASQICINGDGSKIFVAGHRGVKLIDFHTKEYIFNVEIKGDCLDYEHSDAIHCSFMAPEEICYDEENQTFIIATHQGKVIFFDINSGEFSMVFSHLPPIKGADFRTAKGISQSLAAQLKLHGALVSDY